MSQLTRLFFSQRLIWMALALLSACGGGGGSRQSGSVENEGATTTAATKIEFLLAEPDLIYLEGTPGPSRSLLTFKVLDGQNRPVANALVRLSLPATPTSTVVRLTFTSIRSTTKLAVKTMYTPSAWRRLGATIPCTSARRMIWLIACLVTNG